jgi:hypothetical protein
MVSVICNVAAGFTSEADVTPAERMRRNIIVAQLLHAAGGLKQRFQGSMTLLLMLHRASNSLFAATNALNLSLTYQSSFDLLRRIADYADERLRLYIKLKEGLSIVSDNIVLSSIANQTQVGTLFVLITRVQVHPDILVQLISKWPHKRVATDWDIQFQRPISFVPGLVMPYVHVSRRLGIVFASIRKWREAN